MDVSKKRKVHESVISVNKDDYDEEREKRKKYEKKRRENLTQAFEDLKKVLKKFNYNNLESRHVVIKKAIDELNLIDERKNKTNDESSYISDIPGLRELLSYIESLKEQINSESLSEKDKIKSNQYSPKDESFTDSTSNIISNEYIQTSSSNSSPSYSPMAYVDECPIHNDTYLSFHGENPNEYDMNLLPLDQHVPEGNIQYMSMNNDKPNNELIYDEQCFDVMKQSTPFISRLKSIYNSFDMDDLPYHSTTMLDFSKKLLTVVFFAAFFLINLDTSILKQTYEQGAASGTRFILTLGNFTPHWAQSLAAVIWSSFLSAMMFFLQPLVIIILSSMLGLFFWMLTSNEPIFSVREDFMRRADNHIKKAKYSKSLLERKNHLYSALTLLGRNVPGSSRIKLTFLFIWQISRLISHIFLVGKWIERLLLPRNSSLKACIIYMDILKRCTPVCSSSEVVYFQLALINTSVSLKNSVLLANAYALSAFVSKYKFSNIMGMIPEFFHKMAWRAAKKHQDAFGMCYLLGYSMLQRLCDGKWKEAKTFGRLLSSKCDDQLELNKKKENSGRDENEPVIMEDLHCVPLTFSVIDYAAGKFDLCLQNVLESIKMMESCEDVVSVQHESKICWLIIADLYIRKNDLENAKYYLDLWKETSERGYHSQNLETIYYGLMAIIYYREKSLSKAYEMSTLALKRSFQNYEVPIWTMLLYSSYIEILLLLWEEERKSVTDSQKSSSNSSLEDIDAHFNTLLKISLKHLNGVSVYNNIMKPQFFRIKGAYHFIKNEMKLAFQNWVKSYEWSEILEMPFEKAKTMVCIANGLKKRGGNIMLRKKEFTKDQLLILSKSIYNDLNVKYEAEECDKELSKPLLHVIRRS